MSTEKRLKPLSDYVQLAHAELAARALKICSGALSDPAKFPQPHVDLNLVKSVAQELAAANQAAMDGSKTAKALRDQKRASLLTLLRDLGHYLEMSNVDLPTFLDTGFTPRPPRVRVTNPVEKTNILRVENGNPGQLLVTIKPVARARHYEVRFADITEGAATAWSSTVSKSARLPVSITNLTPGRNYRLEARAFGPDVYSEWCESAQRISA